MNTHDTLYLHPTEMPLWRLLVALDDAERIAGPNSPTARVLARTIRERLRQEGGRLPTPGRGGVSHAD